MIDITHLKQLKDLEFNGKILLIREDLNAPISEGKVSSDARLKAAIPTIELALSQGASVILMSHLGRPKEGTYSEEFSLKPVATHLGSLLNIDIPVITDWKNGIDFNQSKVVMLENVRFNSGEKTNDAALSKAYAQLADIVVMDAFGTAHRAQASTEGVIRHAKQSCAGPLLYAELQALNSALDNPEAPLVAIVGGSKVSTKLDVLNSLIDMTDQLIVGGGIANTFLAAAGYSVGNSLYEADLIDTAKVLLDSGKIPLPVDVVTSKTFSADAIPTTLSVDQVSSDDMILDIGPHTAKVHQQIIESASTILWNGPVGVFEFEAFAQGTHSLAKAIAEASAFSVAGGGDTLAAIDTFGITQQVSYISTGGGAFLEYVEGKQLPAVIALLKK